MTERTREEAERLYTENQKLVGYFYKKYAGILAPFADITPADALQLIRMSMWKAIMSFDPERSSLSTLLGHSVFNDMRTVAKHRNRTIRAADNCMLSLDVPASADADCLIIDLIPSDADVERDCVLALDIEAIRVKLKPKELQAFDMRMQGLTYKEIGKAIGCSRQRVEQYMKKAAAFAELPAAGHRRGKRRNQ